MADNCPMCGEAPASSKDRWLKSKWKCETVEYANGDISESQHCKFRQLTQAKEELAGLRRLVSDVAIALSATGVLYDRDKTGQEVFAAHDVIRAAAEAAKEKD